MPRALLISSQVVAGAVGLSVAVPAMTALGVDVLPLPTILLSSHAGVPGVVAQRTDVALLDRMLGALEAAGHLQGLDAVVTGYLPSAAHAAFAVEAIGRVRAHSPNALRVVDPILGDWPKGLYLDLAAAEAIRDRLVPCADLLKPNAFELGWLTRRTITSEAEAIAAARTLNVTEVVVSSVVHAADKITTLAVTPQVASAHAVARLPRAPHGTGDLLTALVTARRLHGVTLEHAVSRAVVDIADIIGPKPSADLAPQIVVAQLMTRRP
jgi:pyridoxine kinase